MDKRKLKKETIKQYRKAGLSRLKATEKYNEDIKNFKQEIKHQNSIDDLFNSHKIKNIEFYIETENGNNVSCVVNLNKMSYVEEEADLKLSNIDKKGYINLNNLDLINFDIFCASISVVFEEERSKEDAEYLKEIYLRVFIQCLLYYKHNTFSKLKEEIKKAV